MAEARAVSPIELARLALSRTAKAAARKVRFTVVLSLALICGSFASAALIQMRLDRAHALDQASQFETVRASEIATDLSRALDRYADLARAFGNATGTAETSAALAEAGGPALKNIVVLNAAGALVSEMKGPPRGLLPLPRSAFPAGRASRSLAVSNDGETIAIIARSGERYVIAAIDPALVLPAAGMDGAVIATAQGRVLLAGGKWAELPIAQELKLDGASSATRVVELVGGARLIALSAVPGWPAVVGASVKTGDALGAWYGSLPLYLFFILGPALAGAGLAVVFVREFERRTRAAEAIKSLRAIRPADARLLIRLADAERRAVEAERAKSEFVSHMSHELRTPLNAIIGFSEVIQHGIFGAAGHPKYVEYARDIGDAGRNLHTKIGDILDFADIEAGRHPIAAELCDVSAIARETIDELAGRAFSRRIKLTVSLIENARAIADSIAVKRILSNLVSNALRFTPQGGAVRLQVRIEEGAVVASVRDSGLGFSPEETVAAGEAFTRFDRPGAETGVGMGLAIAMALARRLGGAVRLAGSAGEGAYAELRLPKA